MSKLKTGVPALIVVLGVAQFIQPERANPPQDPAASFDAVAKPTRQIAQVLNRACRDCHSNQTVWPWYSRISPVSWLVAQDVKEGRAHLNFSEWNRLSPEMSKLRLGAICDEVRKGDMPLWYYLPLHPGARLSREEVAAICAAQ